MNASDFNKLNLSQRFTLVFYSGECIATHKSYGSKTSLYVLQGYYIEVIYLPGTGHIETIEILEPTDERLIIYASPINLSDLL